MAVNTGAIHEMVARSANGLAKQHSAIRVRRIPDNRKPLRQSIFTNRLTWAE
jgi:hypothetical protein